MIFDGNDIIYKVMSFLFLNFINLFGYKNNVSYKNELKKRGFFYVLMKFYMV